MAQLMTGMVTENTPTRVQKDRRQRSSGLLPLTAALLALLWGGAEPLYAGAGCCEEGQNEVLTAFIWDYSPVGLPLQFGCLLSAASLDLEFKAAGGWAQSVRQNKHNWKLDWTVLDHFGVDGRDFTYFCGRGIVGGIVLTANPADNLVMSSEVDFGDVDLEWVVFDSSLTLGGGTQAVDSWGKNAFKGLHLLIGWKDSRLDGNSGGEFADELIGGDSFVAAWMDSDGGCSGQASGTTQRILAEDWATLVDHVHGQGFVAPDPIVDGIILNFTHDC